MMSTRFHVVRGDLCAETLRLVGIPRSQLLILHDSLSWGPCSEADDDSGRNAFWQGMLGLPPTWDFALLEAALKNSELELVVWPEAFLDSAIGIAWMIATVSRLAAGRAPVLLPRATDIQPLFLDSEAGKVAMISDVRPVSAEELGICTRVWRTHLAGQLQTLPALLAHESIAVPRWLSAIEAATDRYPFLNNGLPPFIDELLKPLQDAAEGLSVARLVGGFMQKRSNTSLFIDTDVLLYRLVRELEEKWNLVALDCIDKATYPARCQVSLTQAGTNVLNHVDTIDVRTSTLLRWWGGQDLAAHP